MQSDNEIEATPDATRAAPGAPTPRPSFVLIGSSAVYFIAALCLFSLYVIAVWQARTAPGTLAERLMHLRTPPASQETSGSFADGDLYADPGMTWKLDPRSMTTAQWQVQGHTMTMSLFLVSTSISGKPGIVLHVRIPDGRTAAARVRAPIMIYEKNAEKLAFAEVVKGGNDVSIVKMNEEKWEPTNRGTEIYGRISFEVQ